MAEYFTRLSLIMSQGKQVNEILVLEPTTTAWMYQGDPAKLNPLGERFQKLVTDLAKAQVEFDLGCEDIIARHGSVKDDRFVVGERSYHTVVLPPDTENLHEKTLELLSAYAAGGGRLLCCGAAPTRVDGRESPDAGSLTKQSGFREVDSSKLVPMLPDFRKTGFGMSQAGEGPGSLFHQRRRVKDGQFLFMVNTSVDSPCMGAFLARAGGVQKWNLHTGEVEPYVFVREDNPRGEDARSSDFLTAYFTLPPCGSLLLFLADSETKLGAPDLDRGSNLVRASGDLKVRRLNPNVLTLDFVDLQVGEETHDAIYVCNAAKTVFQKHGLPQGNPWSRAVQFGDELITKTFPADSGFSATYRFEIAGGVPEALEMVIERPDLYTITCNEKPVQATKDTWWLDKAFGRIDLSDVAKSGENAVTIKASPLTIWHELEPAYVIGDFAVRPRESGFVIAPAEPLQTGSWKTQGMPLNGHAVSYTQQFEVDEKSGAFEVELPKWYGSVAKVTVNGQPAGHIAFQPWKLDVTDHIRSGKNTIEVVVIGTLKNTLGPHHAGKMVGRAWPHAFEQGPKTGPPPGATYDTLDYGMFEPFLLRQSE